MYILNYLDVDVDDDDDDDDDDFDFTLVLHNLCILIYTDNSVNMLPCAAYKLI